VPSKCVVGWQQPGDQVHVIRHYSSLLDIVAFTLLVVVVAVQPQCPSRRFALYTAAKRHANVCAQENKKLNPI
jgi:hypothetical protein